MATSRIVELTDVSSDTGEVTILGQGLSFDPNPAQGFSEQIIQMRMRIKTNVPDASGQFLVSVFWNDGNSDQSWDVTLSNIAGAYTEVGMDIWADASRDLTYRVQPLTPGGSVDVRILAGSFQ